MLMDIEELSKKVCKYVKAIGYSVCNRQYWYTNNIPINTPCYIIGKKQGNILPTDLMARIVISPVVDDVPEIIMAFVKHDDDREKFGKNKSLTKNLVKRFKHRFPNRIKVTFTGSELWEEHHIWPTSRKGADSKTNKKRVPSLLHFAWHILFNNKTPNEILVHIVKHWFGLEVTPSMKETFEEIDTKVWEKQ